MALANVNYNALNNEEAIEYYIKAIDSSIYLKGNERKRVVPVYVNLGTLFLDRKDYVKSEIYLQQGYKLAKELNHKQGIADVSLELSRLYVENNTNLKKAEEILQNCIHTYKDLGDNPFLIDSYISLGNLYLVTNELEKSIDIKNKAVKLAEKEKLVDYYYASAISLAKSYFKNENFNKALKYANEVLKDTSDAKMTVSTKLSLFEVKSDLAEKNNNFKQAFLFSKILNKEKEKQFKTEKNKIVNDIETKYQTEKKERKIAQQNEIIKTKELEAQKANTRNVLLAIGLLSVLVITFLIWKRYKSEAKAKRIIGSQKRVIEELQKELHHRVKNNLNIIDTFVDKIKEDYQDTALKNKLQELQNRIFSINQVHTQLYHSADVTNVKVKKYVESLAQNIASSFNNKNIVVNQNVKENLQLNADKSFVMGLIINEFLTNSYKYAFEKEGKIEINIEENKKNYILKLSDNGKGLPKDFNIKTVGSYGLRIMKLLARQLKGTFDIKNHKGVELIIQFPKV